MDKRLTVMCKQQHPLQHRYIDGRDDVRCRLCVSEKNRRRHLAQKAKERGALVPIKRAVLPCRVIVCLKSIPNPDMEISRLLHVSRYLVELWLKGQRKAEPWEVRQVIAAMEMGLLEHRGAPMDEWPNRQQMDEIVKLWHQTPITEELQ